jgi:hypothetical protein
MFFFCFSLLYEGGVEAEFTVTFCVCLGEIKNEELKKIRLVKVEGEDNVTCFC